MKNKNPKNKKKKKKFKKIFTKKEIAIEKQISQSPSPIPLEPGAKPLTPGVYDTEESEDPNSEWIAIEFTTLQGLLSFERPEHQ